jgi:hypothetical protein
MKTTPPPRFGSVGQLRNSVPDSNEVNSTVSFPAAVEHWMRQRPSKVPAKLFSVLNFWSRGGGNKDRF